MWSLASMLQQQQQGSLEEEPDAVSSSSVSMASAEPPNTPSPSSSPVASFLGFDNLCEHLRCNDPQTTAVGTTDTFGEFPVGYGCALGEALSANRHVTQLHLPLDTLVTPTLPTGAPGLVQLFPPQAGGEASRHMPTALIPLLVHLSTSNTLRDVFVYTNFTSPIDTNLTQWILSAVAANVNLQMVRVGRGIAVPLPALCRLVERLPISSPLRAVGRLLAHVSQKNQETAAVSSTSHQSHRHIDFVWSHALATNHGALDCLTLYPKSVAAIVESILVHLPSLPCMNELVFYTGSDTSHNSYNATTSGLNSTLNISSRIQHLELAGYDFDGSTMDILWTAIQGYYSTSSNHSHYDTMEQPLQSLVKVSFTNSTFDADATIKFVQFWQTPVSASSPPVWLRELGITGHMASMGEHRSIMFHNVTPGEMAARLLIPPHFDGRYLPVDTIGSRLGKLTLDADVVLDFFQLLAKHASFIRLPHLEVGDIDANDWETLLTYLPQALYIRELTIALHFKSIVVTDLLSMVRRNGSFHAVNLPPDKQSALTTAETRIVQALLQRNRDVPKLVTRPRSLDSTEMTTPFHDQQQGTSPELYPALFEAVKPSCRTAPNTLLLGLLALGDQTGPQSSAMDDIDYQLSGSILT